MNFFDVLTTIFVVLKLTGLITWPWLWVLSPTLIVIAIWLVLVAVGTFLVSR